MEKFTARSHFTQLQQNGQNQQEGVVHLKNHRPATAYLFDYESLTTISAQNQAI